MNKIVALMIERRMISEEDRELYLYGIQLLLERLLGLSSILIICILAGRILEGAVFYTAYSLLRKYAGGYHAGRFIFCYLTSCAAALMCVLLSGAEAAPVCSVILAVLGIPVIFVLAPVEYGSKPLDNIEKARYRRITCIVTVAECLIFAVLFCLKLYSLCFCIGYSFFMMAVLLIVQKILNRKLNTA